MLKIKIAIVMVLVLIVGSITYFSYRETMLYNQAINYFQDQQFDKARDIFERIPDFSSAADFLMEMDYLEGVAYYEDGNLTQAKQLLITYPTYKESSTLLASIQQQDDFLDQLEQAINNDEYRQVYALLLFNPRTDFLKWTPDSLKENELFNQALADVNASFYDAYDGYGFVFDDGKAEFLGTLREVDYDNTTLSNNLYIPTTSIISDDDISDWQDIVSIAVGYGHVVGLKNDGTVVARGSNKYGQLNVEDWSDIIKIDAGQSYTIGLKSDGTVVFTGYNFRNSINVSTWTDVNDIFAGPYTILGIRDNNAINVTGFRWDTGMVYLNLNSAIQAQANSSNLIALLDNGQVSVIGSDTYGQKDISAWQDIVEVGVGGNYFVGRSSLSSAISRDVLTVQALYVAGLSSDGNVFVNGNLANKNTSTLVNIKSFKLGNQAIIGLNQDNVLVSSDQANNEIFATIDNIRQISE